MGTHKLKKIVSLVAAMSLMLGLMLAATVYAVEKPTVDLAGTNLTISGDAGGFEKVTCIITKPGYTDVNQITVDEIDKAYHYVNEIIPTDGTYTFSFLMLDDDESGDYTVFIGGDGTMSEGVTFYYASKNDRLDAIKRINDATDADSLTDVLIGAEDDDEDQKEYYQKIYNAMGFMIDGYLKMSATQQAEVNEALYANGADYTGDDASDKAAAVFNNALALSCVNHAEDAETMMQQITAYNAVFEFDLSETGLYGELQDDEKELVHDAVYDRVPFDGEEDLQTAFNEELRVPYLNAIAYGDFIEFCEENNEYLQFDLDAFNDLDEDIQTEIAKAMANRDFDYIEEARDEFDELLKEDYDDDGDNYGGGGGYTGGGSSGGGNRGGNSVTDVYIGDREEENNEPDIIEPSTDGPYDDIDDVSWAKDSILSLSEKGIVSGDGNRKFRPNDNIKREEFLKIALEAFQLVDADAACSLEDVPADAWYYKYVASGIEKELVNGMDDSHFGIGVQITRQDMATLAYRIAVYAGVDLTGDTEVTFDDEGAIADYAKEAVAAMSANGIINGIGDGNFAPNSFATRAQACKIISQLLSLTE